MELGAQPPGNDRAPECDLAGPVAGHVVVAGYGVTGRAVAGVLRSRSASVTTVDAAAPEADASDLDDADLSAVDLVVASPGWRPDSPLLVRAASAGIPIWSEIELAWRLRAVRPDGARAPWLAVTGTNGKTTTVEMLAAILQAAGLRTMAVGNVGTPAVEAVLDPSYDVFAVEVSSFQLHFTQTMAARAAAVLNIAPDHLDWHGSMEAYAADKGRIYAGVEIACVYNAADKATEDLVRDADVTEGARAVGFTLAAPGPGQLGIIEDILVDRAFHAPFDDHSRQARAAEIGTLADLEHLASPGATVPPHTVADALAAAALARAHGVPAAAVRDGLRGFHPGAHRIQQVGVVGEVAYVDDSKATNTHAASASLATFGQGRVVWIAGGLVKGAPVDDLVARRKDRLRAVVLIGADQRPFAQALARHAAEIPVMVVDPDDTGDVMTRAVESARRLAHPGDTVLLAPAAASQDQFRSYAERGEAFARAVRAAGEA